MVTMISGNLRENSVCFKLRYLKNLIEFSFNNFFIELCLIEILPSKKGDRDKNLCYGHLLVRKKDEIYSL